MFPKSAVLAIAGLLAICSAAEAAALTVKEEMKQFVEPLSNTLFAVGGEADPANGPDAPKVTDQRWDEAAKAADTMTRVAEAMTEQDRAKPGPEWATLAKQMHDISERALNAAKTRDGAGLAQAANDLSDNCSACHAKFKPQTGD